MTSCLICSRSGIINVIEEESPPPPPKTDDKDPFNISNDEYYAPKTQDNLIKVAAGGGIFQHATPVVELQVPFVPTHMGPIKLRAFHRPPLKRYSHGPLADYTRSVDTRAFGSERLKDSIKFQIVINVCLDDFCSKEA